MRGQRAVVTAAGQVELQAFEAPQPAAGQVLLRASTTLVSPGTERAFFLNLENTQPEYPYYPGYCFVGEVVACGAKVESLQVGDRIACTAGHASCALMEAGACQRVPEGLTDEAAAFFNLLAISMQGVRKARIELGESVLVLGAGLIGILAMRLAQLSGGLPVVGVDRNERRLALAREVGADAVLLGDEDLAKKLRTLLGSEGASVVIEATGAPDLVLSAFQLAAEKGRVVLLGSSRGLTEKVNFYRDVHRKGLTVIGGHEFTRPAQENSPGYWTQRSEHQVSLDLLARGRVDVRPLISHRYGWRDFRSAYERLARWDEDALGLLIQWT